MKKKIALIIGGVALAGAIVAAVALYPILSMRPEETGLVPDAEIEITAVRSGRSCLYVIPTGEGLVLVDAGSNADGVVDSMSREGIDPAEVKHILLTHSDGDHVAALAKFPNAKIYMGEDELQLLDGRTKRNGSGGTRLPEGVSPDDAELLSDGRILNIGEYEIRCVKTPGHTPGSMSYVINSDASGEEYWFTGDAVRIDGTNMTAHPFTMDEDQAKETIMTLSGAFAGDEAAMILTSHYGAHEILK